MTFWTAPVGMYSIQYSYSQAPVALAYGLAARSLHNATRWLWPSLQEHGWILWSASNQTGSLMNGVWSSISKGKHQIDCSDVFSLSKDMWAMWCSMDNVCEECFSCVKILDMLNHVDTLMQNGQLKCIDLEMHWSKSQSNAVYCGYVMEADFFATQL